MPLHPTRAASMLPWTAAVATALLCSVSTAIWAEPAARREYSPYLDKHPNQVFFGDTHVHTSFSADAGFAGTTLGPEDAYRFALGEEVTSSTGVRAKLSAPLDFMVVADHAENLGLAPLALAADPAVMGVEFGRELHELLTAGRGVEAFDRWRKARASGHDPMEGESAASRTAWGQIIEAAERFNQPGHFTAFIGYEWTSVPGGNNLHRNVIFRDGRARASQVLPFSAYDSEDAEDLWEWMAAYEAKTGGRMLAIPHNGNLSNGLMFDDVTLSERGRRSIDDYAERRAALGAALRDDPNERRRGERTRSCCRRRTSSRTSRPGIRAGSARAGSPKTPDMIPNEYAREALTAAASPMRRSSATNPWKFGLIGLDRRAHRPSRRRRKSQLLWQGQPSVEPTSRPQERFDETRCGPQQSARNASRSRSTRPGRPRASGLAAVWARENTREALVGCHGP